MLSVTAHEESSARIEPIVPGDGEGELVWSGVGLSFWGGVDPATGTVIDRHHPLRGVALKGKILALPQSRGSCTGSAILLELALNGHAPAAILVSGAEEMLALGSIVADAVFGRPVPLYRVDRDTFEALGRYGYGVVEGDRLHLHGTSPAAAPGEPDLSVAPRPLARPPLRLTERDRDMLSGRHGKAREVAMQLLVRMAGIQGAEDLVDVTQVHIDGCCYQGSAGLRLAQMLVDWGAKVCVPTTLNAISVDRRRWRDLGVDAGVGEPAEALADAYVTMGASPTFTCAPYLLDTAPRLGEQVGWGESNAVAYANSVLGARTLKYPDYLDVCVALTGRAPRVGCHVDAGRRAGIGIAVSLPADRDDSFWPLLGYRCGTLCGGDIPLISGLEASEAGSDDLKAFAAAFATVAAAPMFHIAGITPEADGQAVRPGLRVDAADLRSAWDALNTAADAEVGLVSLGNPHFSVTEFARFAALIRGRRRAPAVSVVVTCGRAVHDAASRLGYVAATEDFGATIITDTCWCLLGEPIVPPRAGTLMTNSGKYAHYAPGLTGRAVRFGSLSACVEAACSGSAPRVPPAYLDVRRGP